MGLLSFQHDTARMYLGETMNSSLQVPPQGGFRDIGSETSQRGVPSLGAMNISTFGAQTAWQKAHTGRRLGIMKGASGTFINFDTQTVDPSVR